MHKSLRIALVPTVIGALVAMALPAANPPSFFGPTLTQSQVSAGNVAESQIEKMRTTLSDLGGVVQFDAAAAIRLGAEAQTVDQVAAGIAAGGGVVTGFATPLAATRLAAFVFTSAKPRCAGSQNYSTQWFGYQLKVNSCTAQSIIGYLAAGAGVAAIAAVVTSETGIGGIAGAVVAGILAIGGGVLTSCAANGSGVIIDLSWNGVPWCTAQ